jgi:hypothetical protein
MIKQTAIMERQERIVEEKKKKDNVNKVILTHICIVQESVS